MPRGPHPATTLPKWGRVLWLTAGALALAAGLLGMVLPLLPTTPFVLLAAFCFSKGSARWERWLLAHPRLGPMVRDWRERGAVPRRAKVLALAMMAGSCAVTLALLGWPLGALPWLPCVLVGAWLWRRPEPAAVPPAPGAG